MIITTIKLFLESLVVIVLKNSFINLPNLPLNGRNSSLGKREKEK
jgi:hypothetical protein